MSVVATLIKYLLKTWAISCGWAIIQNIGWSYILQFLKRLLKN